MIVPGNGATGGEKVGGGSVSVRGTRACLRAAPLLCCPVALHAARLPCCPTAPLPCCPAAAHAGMLPCSQADVLMRRVINPDSGAAVLPRRPATANLELGLLSSNSSSLHNHIVQRMGWNQSHSVVWLNLAQRNAGLGTL